MDTIEMQSKIKAAKKSLLDFCLAAGFGHPSSAYSLSEILAVLYYNVLRYNKFTSHPDMNNRDRLIISNNHASIMTFPYLHDIGFITDDEYKTIMQAGTKRVNYTNAKFAGMEFISGSLGIGLGVAVGIAKAAQLNNKDHLTFCIVGDCECAEGSIWESVMFAGHNHLNNLIVIFDNNNLGVTDYACNMISMEPIESRWASFGFETRRVNGHDLEQLNNVFADIRARKSDKPLCIVADTIKGKGVDFMENKLLWHGAIPKGENIALAYAQLEEE